MVAADPARFSTRELSRRTWPDFKAFHSSVHGCGCMLYLRGRHLSPVAASAEDRAKLLGAPDRSKRSFPHHDWWMAQNLAEMKDLAWSGRAHGILVYAGKEPVGWCQYGRTEEMPIVPNRKIPPERLARDATSDWRITCLTTRRDYRQQGVATTALAAAVEAVRESGGGRIESTPVAYPHDPRTWRKVRRAHGPRSDEMKAFLEDWPERHIPGVGTVKGAAGGIGDHRGTMAMFEKLGFQPIRRDEYGSSSHWWIPYDLVVMQLQV
jgi:ribosomal protein S18 acetylase RimI-like enzyme